MVVKPGILTQHITIVNNIRVFHLQYVQQTHFLSWAASECLLVADGEQTQ